MKIFFIRHGQTTGDVEDRYGGNYDDYLSPEGKKQLDSLLEELKDKNIDLVISSPFKRAHESAQVIAHIFDCSVIVENDIKERNQYGILTGLVKSEAKAQHPDLVEKLKDRLNTIEGAESYENFRERIEKAFNNIASDQKHDCIAVVWHGGPMRVLFRDILKKGELKEVGDCCWVMLEKENDQFVIKDSRRIELL